MRPLREQASSEDAGALAFGRYRQSLRARVLFDRFEFCDRGIRDYNSQWSLAAKTDTGPRSRLKAGLLMNW